MGHFGEILGSFGEFFGFFGIISKFCVFYFWFEKKNQIKKLFRA
jgi:hypothetical protein